MKLRWFVLLFMSCVALFAGCTQSATPSGGLQIVDPWARPAMMVADQPASAAMTTTAAMTTSNSMSATMGMGIGGAMGAVYMTIRNPGQQVDRLVNVASDAAKAAELHAVSQDKNGVMAMHPVDGIDVPANGEVALQPGGFHIMLIGLTRDLKVGDQVTVTLTFDKGGNLAVAATVRER